MKKQTTTTGLTGKTVKVYRNLRTGTFSVQHQGLVVAHLETVHLLGVRFAVSEAGRQRVIRDKQKNVHAFLIGTLTDQAPATAEAVSYNPYHAGHFFAKQTGAAVYTAPAATLTTGRIFI